MDDRIYYIYIMTNQYQTTLYTGITNNLFRRVMDHKTGAGSQFSRRYNLTTLVYFEIFDDVKAAISREKQLKGGSRQKKMDLINSINPEWRDLSDEF